GLGDPLVERDDVFDGGLTRRRERDEQPFRLGARGSEVAEVDRRGAVAEVTPLDPVEQEVDTLDERILGDDEVRADAGRVVLDADDQPTLLELRQEAELTELREPRQPPS